MRLEKLHCVLAHTSQRPLRFILSLYQCLSSVVKFKLTMSGAFMTIPVTICWICIFYILLNMWLMYS